MPTLETIFPNFWNIEKIYLTRLKRNFELEKE